MKVRIYDIYSMLSKKAFRLYEGTPEEVIEELMKTWKIKNNVKQFGQIIRKHLSLPNWCRDLLDSKNIPIDSDLATIFFLAYGAPSHPWIAIDWIKWDDGTLTTEEDLSKMEFGEEKLNDLRKIGLFLS
jgi:hypothetical protein